MKANVFHVLNAGKQLPEALAEQVEAVARAAFARQTTRLGLDGVDAVLYTSPWTIPETGMVGTAPDGYSVHLAVTPQSPQFLAHWRTELPATLAHELHHAKRWRHAGLGTLLEALVFEGLAQHYEVEERGEVPLYARPTVALDELWARAEQQLDGPYDHQAWFFGDASHELPRWGGYALGFELVRRFLERQGGDAVIHASISAEAFRSAWSAH
ncbi:DUF2268 domain-containing putative Zn-dependent protease [Deinococcus aquaedulcis]|uniref:DUF2268 domain-containing putative Zn-dependent protease n=1 Tax=Deinococcus aquaedulcis TaxID=2840455 RepID=UPI001C8396B9|nr:DUF2268 domain-containing putative Zn-dependent protease [Deinococcus aquaedulcis]